MNLPSGKRWLKSSEFSMVSHHLPQCCGCARGELSRDSRESRDRSEEYTGGSSRPRSRLREGPCRRIIRDSFTFRLYQWSSLHSIFVFFIVHRCPVVSKCSLMAELEPFKLVCSLKRNHNFEEDGETPSKILNFSTSFSRR